MTESSRASLGKRFLASFLDFFTAFFAIGMAIGYATGSATSTGFKLSGGPALLFFALLIAYFVVGRRFAGGTLWDRILGIARPQPRRSTPVAT